MQALILKNLINDEKYCRKVGPFLKKEYFEGGYQMVFIRVLDFIGKYNKLPSVSALKIELEESYNQSQLELVSEVLNEINLIEDKPDFDWLIDKTEEYCQNKAVMNAVLQSFSIIEGKDKKYNKSAIPDLLSDALSVTFDTAVGHDYFEDADDRFRFYTNAEERIPFDIDLMNEITGGGAVLKSLNGFLAGTGVGKSLVMCHMAAANIKAGIDVLYITLEMAEEKIAQRIDANLLNVPISQIENLPEITFKNKVQEIKDKSKGRLIVKQYPTSAAHVGHFRALLDELKMKKDFKPTVVYIDYLNIAASSRLKTIGGSVNSYTYIKAIAEEIRGLAVEKNICIWTATQSNRDGANNSDMDITNTSECIYVGEKVTLRDGTVKRMDEIRVGDQIASNDMYKTVINVHHKKIKKCYRIKTASGKSIIVSEDHVFPTSDGRMSLKSGLGVGKKLLTR